MDPLLHIMLSMPDLQPRRPRYGLAALLSVAVALAAVAIWWVA